MLTRKVALAATGDTAINAASHQLTNPYSQGKGAAMRPAPCVPQEAVARRSRNKRGT